MLYHALATIEKGAVGNHAIAITNEVKRRGISIEMFAETIREEYQGEVSYIDELEAKLSEEDVVLYQFANPSIMADLLYEKPCKLIVNYHNVTPARYFSKWDSSSSQIIARAQLQLARLSEVAHSAIAVSGYNAQELIELGYKNVSVIPPVFSSLFYESEIGKRNYDHAHWLYVGRISPHKNINILLRAFDYYRNHIDKDSKLTIVGYSDSPTYGTAINELIQEREFGDSLCIVTNASEIDLVDIYKQATVFVTASEHEGFCVPLVEAMSVELPVVAISRAAIADTVSSAGIVLEDTNYISIAHAVEALHNNEDLRADIISKGKVRAAHFDPTNSAVNYAQYLESVV